MRVRMRFDSDSVTTGDMESMHPAIAWHVPTKPAVCCVLTGQEHMGQVEQQMQGLQAALEAGTAASAALEATNATLAAERIAAGNCTAGRGSL